MDRSRLTIGFAIVLITGDRLSMGWPNIAEFPWKKALQHSISQYQRNRSEIKQYGTGDN
jgi:hypothetical protein